MPVPWFPYFFEHLITGEAIQWIAFKIHLYHPKTIVSLFFLFKLHSEGSYFRFFPQLHPIMLRAAYLLYFTFSEAALESSEINT